MNTPPKKIVSKFGGTSMGDAACMLRSAEISLKQGSVIVVVSATSGTTNQLIELGKTAEKQNWPKAEAILNQLIEKHQKIAFELKVSTSDLEFTKLTDELHSVTKGIYLLRDCSLKVMDALQSWGERVSSFLFSKALEQKTKELKVNKKVQLLDVREIILTDSDYSKARPQIDEIQKRAAQKFNQQLDGSFIFATQGFIGQTADGNTTTLGRGGSDYSAALFAEAIHADLCEIWTDVPGIATTDPRLCSEAKIIPEISFQEASELATFGAKVLHPATLAPAMRKNIPVFVGSSFDPQQKGTWIRKEVHYSPLIRALALRKKQVLVTLTTPEMLHSHGFLYRIFNVFNHHKVSVDAITTSEISVSLTLDDSTLLNRKLIEELSQFADVQVEENLSLVSIIGNQINHTPGLAKKVFDNIDGINVRMICLGASRHNFCFLVDEVNGPLVIEKLHKGFSLEKAF
jgi:aspartate kinase